MLAELDKHDVHITAVYYCPHLPAEKCENISPELKQYRISCSCRKPKLELFERAIRDFSIDLSKSFAIGDKQRDIAICKDTACQGFLIYEEVSSLFEVAKIITGG